MCILLPAATELHVLHEVWQLLLVEPQHVQTAAQEKCQWHPGQVWGTLRGLALFTGKRPTDS